MLRKLVKILLLVVLLIAAAGGLWYWLTPVFGGKLSPSDLARLSASPNWRDGHFVNREPTALATKATEQNEMNMLSWLKNVLLPPKGKVPDAPLPSMAFDPKVALANVPNDASVTWLGHSTLVIHMDGETIVTDPVFYRASPVPVTGKPFETTHPMEPWQLPQVIDALLITHDHYDHLEYDTINQIKSRVGQFYVPLGVGAHLIAWGVDPSRITELDWDQSVRHGTLTITLTTSRHFSGRTLSDRDRTLWGGFVIAGTERFYVSGDGGYGKHFREIGEKYGPFDMAFIENGAYNRAWAQIHMTPEESHQAALDVRAKRVVPIHWAKFDLAYHPWTEPIERYLSAAERDTDLCVVLPLIGESFRVSDATKVHHLWWRKDFTQR